jgi:hypothetical protein
VEANYEEGIEGVGGNERRDGGEEPGRNVEGRRKQEEGKKNALIQSRTPPASSIPGFMLSAPAKMHTKRHALLICPYIEYMTITTLGPLPVPMPAMDTSVAAGLPFAVVGVDSKAHGLRPLR